jgi:hypothetical protein
MAAALFGILALGVAAVVSVSAMNDSVSVASKPAVVADVAASHDSAAEATPSVVAPKAGTPALRPNPSLENSTFGAAYAVQDSDINQLAEAVKLGESAAGDVGKEVWVRETPIAEKLLQGLCDCDQRNWLKHFIETGHEAIDGSEQYYPSVQLLATLRHSNADLAKNQGPQ